MEDAVSIVTLDVSSEAATLPVSSQRVSELYSQHPATRHQNHSATSQEASDCCLQIEVIEETGSCCEKKNVMSRPKDKKKNRRRQMQRLSGNSSSEGYVDLEDIVSVKSGRGGGGGGTMTSSQERLVLDNEDVVWNREEDCYRTTLAGTDHPALRRAAKPKRELTQDEAATKIQSNFRGFKARKENPEIAENIKQRKRFGEATVEGEAARYVQYYFRKWKMRTLFQTLQTYRADRQQQLVYFSQQVHLYSQELQAKMQRINMDLDLGKIRNEAPGAHKTILARAASALPKLALDHTLNAYFDTTFLCDPTRAKKGRGIDDDWEAPFKSKQSAASQARAQNMGLDAGGNKDQGYNQHLGVKSRTAMFNQAGNENNNNYSSSNTGYNRFAGSGNTPKNPSYNRFAGSNMNKPSSAAPSYNKFGGSYLNSANNSQASRPSVVVNSWSDRGHNGYSNNNNDDGEDTGATHDFRKHLRRTNIHAEMEARARSTGNTGGADEEAPFNFQGMLRKTKVTRDSLRRSPSPGGTYYEPPAIYEPPRADTPTFTEETEEAML